MEDKTIGGAREGEKEGPAPAGANLLLARTPDVFQANWLTDTQPGPPSGGGQNTKG